MIATNLIKYLVVNLRYRPVYCPFYHNIYFFFDYYNASKRLRVNIYTQNVLITLTKTLT